MPRRKKTEAAPAPAKKGNRKPSLAGVMNLTAAKADTEGTNINVAETKRVIKCFVEEVKDNYTDPTDRMQFLLKNFF